jgi:UDP-N-acetylmuramate--alanine ligase
VCVFQPHRYTRTSDVGADFADAFADADEVIVTGIYSAGETPIPGVTGKLVADAITHAHPEAPVRYVEHRDDLARHLRSILVEGDLCLTLGAGDLTTLPDELLRG